MDGDKLLVLVSLTILDRENIFEVFTVVNLLIPYPCRDERGEVARYKLEAENMALNVVRSISIILTPEEAKKCEKICQDHVCPEAQSYVRSSHELCILVFLRGYANNEKKLRARDDKGDDAPRAGLFRWNIGSGTGENMELFRL